MGRRRRNDDDIGWFHVMNRGVDRQQIFFADTDRVDFGRLLGVAAERFCVEVHAYCLMTNHFHLLLRCQSGGISSYMHDVGSAFSRHVNDRLGRDGPLFRGRFRSVRVNTDNQVRCVVRYIHRNPLDISSVDEVDIYRWSSHRTYLDHRRRPTWLQTEFVLDMFGGDAKAFDEFVRSTDQSQAEVGLGELTPIIELVVDEVWDGAVGSNRPITRAVSMLMLDRLSLELRARLTSELAFPTSGARRTALSRAVRMAEQDPSIRRLMERTLPLVA